MITIPVEPTTLSEMRFAFSPLIDLTASYTVLLNPYHPHMNSNDDWLTEARQNTFGTRFPYMDAVIAGRNYVADFVTPTPSTTTIHLEDEFQRMRETSEEIIRNNIEKVIDIHGLSPIREEFLKYPAETLEYLIEDMRKYWRRTMEQHWGNIVAVLEGDVLYRARQLAMEGPQAVLNNLTAALRFQNGSIVIDKPNCPYNCAFVASELRLVPSMFLGDKPWWQMESDWEPMILYGARGNGLWYRPERNQDDEALELTMGAGRAGVLRSLIEPSSTGELAQRLNVTSGAISQHLNRLRQAGLVESSRVQNRVYYRLSNRGQQLITLFS